jgi:hypothetical protein
MKYSTWKRAVTHPAIAAPGHPLFGFAGKRDFPYILYRKKILPPSLREAEERAVQRSAEGVS